MDTKTPPIDVVPDQAEHNPNLEKRMLNTIWNDYSKDKLVATASFSMNLFYHAFFFWLLDISGFDMTNVSGGGAAALFVHTFPTVVTSAACWVGIRGKHPRFIEWACAAHCVALMWAAWGFVHLAVPSRILPEFVQATIRFLDVVPVYGMDVQAVCQELDGSFGADHEWVLNCTVQFVVGQMIAAWIALAFILLEFCVVSFLYRSCADDLEELRRLEVNGVDVEMGMDMDDDEKRVLFLHMQKN